MSIQLIGTPTYGYNANAFTCTLPSGYQIGDIFILCVVTENQQIFSIDKFTELTQFGVGVAANDAATRLGIFYKIVTSETESDIPISDFGDSQYAFVFCYRGVDINTPFDANVQTKYDSANTTALVFPPITTVTAEALILNICSLNLDGVASTTQVSDWANSDLPSIPEDMDRTFVQGGGGGLAAAHGVKLVPGPVKATTATGATSELHAYATLALRPASTVDNRNASFVVNQGSITAFIGLGQKQKIIQIDTSSSLLFQGNKKSSSSINIISNNNISITGIKSNTGIFGVTQVSSVEIRGTQDINSEPIQASGTFAVGCPIKAEMLGSKRSLCQTSILTNSEVEMLGIKKSLSQVLIDINPAIQMVAIKHSAGILLVTNSILASINQSINLGITTIILDNIVNRTIIRKSNTMYMDVIKR